MCNLKNNSVFKEKYDFIFSLGAACLCTQTLRMCDLQYASYPFDWVYGSTLKERALMLKNSFPDWLPKDFLECVGEQLVEKIPKLVYKNSITGIVFNHDFSLHEDFEVSYPTVKAKYDRRIARLYKSIRASRTVLMVYIKQPNADVMETNEEIIEAQKNVSSKFPGVKIHLLYLNNDDNVPIEKGTDVEMLAEGVFRARFCYNAFNVEIPYAGNFDVLKAFFSNLYLSYKLLRPLDRLNKWSLRHPVLSFFLSGRINARGFQIIKVFRIRIAKFKRKSNQNP